MEWQRNHISSQCIYRCQDYQIPGVCVADETDFTTFYGRVLMMMGWLFLFGKIDLISWFMFGHHGFKLIIEQVFIHCRSA